MHDYELRGVGLPTTHFFKKRLGETSFFVTITLILTYVTTDDHCQTSAKHYAEVFLCYGADLLTRS
jgi:hypothetical protein